MTGRDYVIGMAGPITLADVQSYLPALTNDCPKGLGGQQVGLLCNELLKRGHKLIIFSLDPGVETEWVIEGERLKICLGPYTRRRARNFFRKERDYLTKAMLREKPTFLHAQWTYEFALAAIASGLPHVVTARDAPINVLRYNFIPYRVVRTLMAYQACRQAQRIVANSPYTAAHLKRFGFHTKPMDVIPNGVPAALFGRSRITRPDGQITFATNLVGWGGYKNGAVVIEAFAKIRDKLSHARLLMFGDGHGQGEVAQNWAQQHDYQDGIEFVGQVPYTRLLEMMSQDVDILVHPALEESFSNAAVEAMAFGIPVIAGRASGGVSWVLGHGQYGVVVDVRSAQDVGRAMLRLAQNADERVRIGNAGRDSVSAFFRIERVADRYEAIYAELAGRHI